MAKLSSNQVAAVAALQTLLSDSGAQGADKNAWRKSAPNGVSVNTKSLVNAGAITVQTLAIGSRIVEVFTPVRAVAEVGG